ncbi:LacI family DNA-binding transcriptional regulator [Fretibacter rubidus]|uniref:LacI family DNA-binding transcriptional regulator n=1 Tax=Fretibacter rubidus TaxID=570162 RepID=UPI00352B2D2A
MTTIIDVAKQAGVSFKTVSRVLNGESNVRPETKDKVLQAAQALNYRVNSAARRLRSKTPHLVALFLNNPSRSYAQDVQIGAMAGCQDAGFTLVVEDPEKNGAIERLAAQDGLLGAILTPPQSDDPKIIARLNAARVPFVRIGTERSVAGSNQVGIDDRAAAVDMTNYLIGLGHRRIGFICGPQDHEASLRRYKGYCDALQAAGIAFDNDIIERGDFTYASGLTLSERLLALENRPSAIFASNDEMAAGCLAAAYRRNIRVPEKLSVTGFDDSPVARVIYPALTTLHQATRDMSQKAIALLDQKRRQDSDEEIVVKLPHELVIRDSTGPFIPN